MGYNEPYLFNPPDILIKIKGYRDFLRSPTPVPQNFPDPRASEFFHILADGRH